MTTEIPCVKITDAELNQVKSHIKAADINCAFLMVMDSAENLIWKLGEKYGVENPVLNMQTGELLPGIGAPRELPIRRNNWREQV